MRSCWVVWLALAACGRTKFDPISDATTAVDVAADTAMLAAPTVVHTMTASCVSCSSLMFGVNPPALQHHGLLLVGAAIALGNPGVPPQTTSLTFSGVPLTLVHRELGNSTLQPMLEIWQLVDPPSTVANLVFTLAGTTDSLVAGATVIDGVNPATPIRAFNATSSTGGMSATNTLASAPGDLAIDTVCTGTSIDAAASGQTPVWSDPAGTGTTCENAASSSQPGAGSVMFQWNVNAAGTDDWVDIAVSVEPGP